MELLKAPAHDPEILVSHANAALTPRHRLKLGRAVVEGGWTISYAAAVFNVSWPTAKKWADRYRTGGPAPMEDRSSRPHSCPRRTPRPVVRKIVHLRWKKRLGPVAIAGRLGLAPSTVHAVYRYWRVLSQVGQVLEEFTGRSYAKSSPVHHFWHTFDLAVTRFSDKRVEKPGTVDSVTREAYSHEVISSGFWFGDDNVPEPAFYSYTAPEPPGLTQEPLAPAAARWIPHRGGHLALLRYDDARSADDPRGTVLDFFESAYVAGARRAPR